MKPGNSELVGLIRYVVCGSDLMTAFDIAVEVDRIHPGRWDEGSVRTACKRAGLIAVDTLGISPRGSRCLRFTLGRTA